MQFFLNPKAMKIIWYNPDEQTYKSGSAQELSHEMAQSNNKSAFTVLRKFRGSSKTHLVKSGRIVSPLSY